jgi:glutamine synthetase
MLSSDNEQIHHSPCIDAFTRLTTSHAVTIVEYIWIGGSGIDIRSKSKTYTKEINTINDIDEWNFDGSSAYLASPENSEIILKPEAMYPDPFRGNPHKLVLCSTYDLHRKPTITNFRHFAQDILNKHFQENEPTFGIEQEYVMKKSIGTLTHSSIPLGWPIGGYPSKQGPYYCSVGNKFVYGREIMETHYKVCLLAGLHIYGTNSEVMPGQWEFQIGTCKGIETADELWMARYLLLRVGEYYNVDIDFSPKVINGEWNGSGCHTNYSNTKTMNDCNMHNILQQISLLEKEHKRVIELYGEDNHLRLTGRNETSSYDVFTWGVANRSASIRIPLNTQCNGRGYYEDRRPSSNMDPYLVCAVLYSITLLDNYGLDDIEAHYAKFKENKRNIN